MLAGLVVILACQVVGEVVVRLLGLPLPGTVLGMVLFVGWLAWRRPKAQDRELAAPQTLLHHLPILFVPTTAGFIVHGPRIAAQWVPALVGSVVSWLLTFVLVGWLAQALARRGAAPAASAPEPTPGEGIA